MEPKEDLESIYTELDTKERGLIKIMTHREYYLDHARGQVILVETEDVDNGYPNARQKKDRRISGGIVPPSLLPPEIREKVKTLMGAESI